MTTDARQHEERLTVLLAQQGDREAFRMLVDLYDRRLLYFVRRILGETDGALDVLQSVWLVVHRKLWKLQSATAFRVWLYRIAHDQAVTELRRKAKRPTLSEDTPTDQPMDPAREDASAFENAELVHTALLGLSVDHRRVLTLRFEVRPSSPTRRGAARATTHSPSTRPRNPSGSTSPMKARWRP